MRETASQGRPGATGGAVAHRTTRRWWRHLPGVAAVGFLGACASAGGAPAPSAGPQRTVVGVDGASPDIELFRDRRAASAAIPAPPAAAWAALPAALADLGLVGGPLAGQAMTYVANFSLRRALEKVPLSRYFDCSATPTGESRANVDVLKGSVTAQLSAQGEGSALVTQVVVRAISTDGASGTGDCASTGALEARLAEALRERLR